MQRMPPCVASNVGSAILGFQGQLLDYDFLTSHNTTNLATRHRHHGWRYGMGWHNERLNNGWLQIWFVSGRVLDEEFVAECHATKCLLDCLL